MSDRARVIVHLDLDAFFAAVEELLNSDLTGKPIIVGGRPEERGVVASASYPARSFGVRSAMPTAQALVLCPEAIVVPVRHEVYRDYSQQVMAILRTTTPIVEQMSIDEAYLDLSDRVPAWDQAIDVARSIQRRVREEARLSASLGVASNKLVAKVASDRDKPGGLTVVRPGEEASFLAPLPVRALWGIGPVTEQKLAEMGMTTIGELARASERELLTRFGSQGAAMLHHAQGIDQRPVVTEHEHKSVSQERTFRRDLVDADSLKRHLWKMSQRVAQHLDRLEMAAGTVAIKLRYADFTTLTRQMALTVPTADEQEIYRVALSLLQRTWQRGRPVRLLGVAGRQLSAPAGQLPLWDRHAS